MNVLEIIKNKLISLEILLDNPSNHDIEQAKGIIQDMQWIIESWKNYDPIQEDST